MALAFKPPSGVGISSKIATAHDVGDPPELHAPLYDEITLTERLIGDVVLQELAAANSLLNEYLSSARHANPSHAALAELAVSDASLRERLSATASVFKH